jgi:uncharacterized protein (TIGR02246 family)
MRTISWIAAPALLACAAPVAAQSDPRAAFAAHVAAVQARDMPALERTITSGDALTLILPNGTRTDTRAAYLAFHREFFASPTWSIRFEILSEISGPDFAVLTTRSFYSDTDNGQPVRTSSWVTFTFRRESGEWRLIHDQNTRVPADLPAG